MPISNKSKQAEKSNNRDVHKRRPAKPTKQGPVASGQQTAPAILQQVMADPSLASPADILTLQRTVGNQAVQRLLAGRGQSGRNSNHPVQAKSVRNGQGASSQQEEGKPERSNGQELTTSELTHIMQRRGDGVSNKQGPVEHSGQGINQATKQGKNGKESGDSGNATDEGVISRLTDVTKLPKKNIASKRYAEILKKVGEYNEALKAKKAIRNPGEKFDWKYASEPARYAWEVFLRPHLFRLKELDMLVSFKLESDKANNYDESRRAWLKALLNDIKADTIALTAIKSGLNIPGKTLADQVTTFRDVKGKETGALSTSLIYTKDLDKKDKGPWINLLVEAAIHVLAGITGILAALGIGVASAGGALIQAVAAFFASGAQFAIGLGKFIRGWVLRKKQSLLAKAAVEIIKGAEGGLWSASASLAIAAAGALPLIIKGVISLIRSCIKIFRAGGKVVNMLWPGKGLNDEWHARLLAFEKITAWLTFDVGDFLTDEITKLLKKVLSFIGDIVRTDRAGKTLEKVEQPIADTEKEDEEEVS